MPQLQLVPLRFLKLDLANPRNTPQRDEYHSVRSMIAISPDKFWGLLESILTHNYINSELLIVLKGTTQTSGGVVKEGNRRVAILKLLHKILDIDKFDCPEELALRVNALEKKWLAASVKVACSVYEPSEKDLAENMVDLTHAKNQTAGRDPWKSIAKARRNRDFAKASEPGLDLLEKYLQTSPRVSQEVRERWAGIYHITILDEALPKVYKNFGQASVREMVDKYPFIPKRKFVDKLIHDIGTELTGFEEIRDQDFPTPGYGGTEKSVEEDREDDSETKNVGGHANGKRTKPKKRTRTMSYPLNDPRSVSKELRNFALKEGREKVATLVDEALKLDIAVTPLAFCFLLRSMFEISAKLYAKENRGSATLRNSAGFEEPLVKILRQVCEFMKKNPTAGRTEKEMATVLHGPMNVLAQSDSLLSITSMNQLVHHETFSLAPKDVATLFSQIFPLLQELNS